MTVEKAFELPNEVLVSEERYRKAERVVKAFIRGFENANGGQMGSDPRPRETLAASRCIREQQIPVHSDIIMAGEIALQERRFVDGYFRNKLMLGIDIHWARPSEHQFYTQRWSEVVHNIKFNAPPPEHRSSRNQTIGQQEVDINWYTTLLESDFARLPLAEDQRAVGHFNEDERPHLRSLVQRTKDLRSAVSNYQKALRLRRDLETQFTATSGPRVYLSCLLELASAAIIENA